MDTKLIPNRPVNGRRRFLLVVAGDSAGISGIARLADELRGGQPADFVLLVPALPVNRRLTWEEGETIALFTACSTALLIQAETPWP